MMLLSDPSLTPIIGRWVSERTTDNGEIGFSGEFEAIAVMHKNVLIAGFVFHDYHPVFQTISMTLAADTPRWATRRTIQGILNYPFNELGVQRIAVMAHENNHASLRLAEGCGFKREAVLERAAGKENIIVLRLFVEEWRNGKFNRLALSKPAHS